jgi:hypothetical protein
MLVFRKDPTMQRILLAHFMIPGAILLSACVTLAPGADQVRITNKASDVGARVFLSSKKA